MSESENLEIYRRFIEEACSPSNLDRMDMFLAPGIGLPTVGEGGIQALKDMHRALRPAFPDLSARIEEISESSSHRLTSAFTPFFRRSSQHERRARVAPS